MKDIRGWLFGVGLAVLGAAQAVAAPLGTGFTYQGQLNVSGSPASGTYHLRFSLWDASSAGSQVGSNQIVSNVLVSGGIFSVYLNGSNQFSSGAFNGDDRWLQIDVCSDAGCTSTTPLTPRQRVSGTPYALTSIDTKKLTNYEGGVVAESYPLALNTAGLFSGRFHNSLLFGSYAEGSSAHGFISTGYTSGAQRKFSIGRASSSNFETATFAPALTVVSSTGNVGIGTETPAHPLSIPNGTGDKIAFSAGTNHFGIGTSSNVLQIHTPSNANHIGFGYGSSASFTEQVRIDGNGRVGIGTSLPTEELDVRGDIRMGSSGQYLAPAGVENLKIIRGACLGNGNVEYGSGFTSSRVFGSGIMNIVFSTPFASTPTVTATPNECSGCVTRFAEILNVTPNGVDIIIYQRSDGAVSGGPLSFIAVGPR